MPTFKKQYPTTVESVLTECDIYSDDGHKFHAECAMWDTGADTTIISSRIVRELQLQPYKQGGISGIGGSTGSNVYLVHVHVPTGDVVTYVEVMERRASVSCGMRSLPLTMPTGTPFRIM